MTSQQPPDSPTPPPGVSPQQPQYRAPGYPQAREGRGVSFFVAIFLGILLLVSGGLNVLLLLLSIGSFAGSGLTGASDDGAIYDLVRTGGSAAATDKVLRIPVQGAISEAQSAVLGGEGGSVSRVRRALRFAAADDTVRALLLDINSPGGGVTDSDEIYRMLLRFKKEHPEVRIVALFGDVAASGGYYIAAAADHIVARRSSITGSIGVIMSAWNFTKAAADFGVSQVAIKSEHTPYKDMLSPTREMTPEERAILTSIVEELYEQFVDVVVAGRGLDRDRAIELANGAIYSAKQALSGGLIDEIGDSYSVQEAFVDQYGPVQVVEYRRRPTFRDLLLGASASALPDPSAALGALLTAGSGPRFLYFWQGGR